MLVYLIFIPISFVIIWKIMTQNKQEYYSLNGDDLFEMVLMCFLISAVWPITSIFGMVYIISRLFMFIHNKNKRKYIPYIKTCSTDWWTKAAINGPYYRNMKI